MSDISISFPWWLTVLILAYLNWPIMLAAAVAAVTASFFVTGIVRVVLRVAAGVSVASCVAVPVLGFVFG